MGSRTLVGRGVEKETKEGEFQGELGEAGLCFLKYYFSLFPIPFFSTFSIFMRASSIIRS